MPDFSVIIPLFNKQDYITATLNSVLRQSYASFEIIVVDDGSTDESLKRVETMVASKIKIIPHKTNKGLAAARNTGIKHARGRFIAFLDADDLWCSDFLETIHRLHLTFPNAQILATNYQLTYHKKRFGFTCHHEYKQGMLIDNYFISAKNRYCYSSVVFGREVFNTIGFFNEEVNYGEEEDFTIRVNLKHKLAYTESPKVFYLKGDKHQLTARDGKKRIIPDYSVYLKEAPSESLKKYISFIHYKLALLYKEEGNQGQYKKYRQKVSLRYLTFIRKVKLLTPSFLFRFLKQGYLKIRY